MSTRISRSSLKRLIESQAGSVSSAQLRSGGFTDSAIKANLVAFRWQRIHPSVIVTFTGPLPFPTQVWAALLWAGSDAVAGDQTALTLFGMRLGSDDEAIHVSIDHRRTLKAPRGIILHRRRGLVRFVHPARKPPSVRFEDAVLHVAARSRKRSDGIAIIADACQQRITSPSRLRHSLVGLPTLPGHLLWSAVLGDVAVGAHSLLEIRYLRDVEQAHGLPPLQRQGAATVLGKHTWRDGEYAKFAIVHELDVGSDISGSPTEPTTDNATSPGRRGQVDHSARVHRDHRLPL